MKRHIIVFQIFILFSSLLLSACTASSSKPTSIPTVLVQPITTKPIATMPAPTATSFQSSDPTSPSAQPTLGETDIPAKPTENALAPETNPVGDIPDNQVFITYTSAASGYSLEVPEGWARTEQGSNVSFVDKFDGMSVTITSTAQAPTAASVPQNEASALAQAERAFQLGKVSEVKLPGGQAVRITASANSDPDPVTGKQVRLDEKFYLFYQNGKLATLKVWAPQGADNVDQWKRISESFRWK